MVHNEGIREGKFKKGGRNGMPKTSRPSAPPKGQGNQNQSEGTQVPPKDFWVGLSPNAMAKKINSYAIKQGFWKDGEKFNYYYLPLKMMLVVSELAECVEGHRHTHKRNYQISENIKEEIADALIRLLDICGGYDIDIEKIIEEKMNYNYTRPKFHGKGY